MTGISLTFQASEALAALGGFEAAPDDMTPLMHDIGAMGVQSTVDRIALTNRAPDGTPWTPSLRQQAEGGKTLQDSARLRDSIDYEASARQVAWGTNVKYGRIHQTGGVIKAKDGGALKFTLPGGGFATVSKVTLPARPYLGLSAEDGEDILAFTVGFLRKAGTP